MPGTVHRAITSQLAWKVGVSRQLLVWAKSASGGVAPELVSACSALKSQLGIVEGMLLAAKRSPVAVAQLGQGECVAPGGGFLRPTGPPPGAGRRPPGPPSPAVPGTKVSGIGP